MKQTSFPAVTRLTPFEQQNTTTSTVTFDRPLTPSEMEALMAAVKRFHASRAPNSRSAMFHLTFPVSHKSGSDGKMRGNDTMQICAYSRFEMPTRQLFDGLLTHLTETLQIMFPELPAGRPDLPIHQPLPRDEEPGAPTRFVRRGGRTFRPGEQY